MNEKENVGYGVYKTFRDFVDGMADKKQLEPETIYIYEKSKPMFAVFNYKWTIDAKKMADYLEESSADCYTGVHFERDSYLVVLIDVANKEK
jgi:hypothetical protein